jgi:hypothetical protein
MKEESIAIAQISFPFFSCSSWNVNRLWANAMLDSDLWCENPLALHHLVNEELG